MDDIDDNKYWSKPPPWKRLKLDRNKKSNEGLQKPKKNILHVASHSEWKLHYEIPGELC